MIMFICEDLQDNKTHEGDSDNSEPVPIGFRIGSELPQ